MKKRFSLILILVVILCTLTSCSKKTETIDIVEATVIDKEYVPHNPVWNGKYFIFVPDSYIVTIEYGEITKKFDDSDLYHRVKKGDTIQMELYTYYLNGKIIAEDLQQIQNSE